MTNQLEAPARARPVEVAGRSRTWDGFGLGMLSGFAALLSMWFAVRVIGATGATGPVWALVPLVGLAVLVAGVALAAGVRSGTVTRARATAAVAGGLLTSVGILGLLGWAIATSFD